MRARLAEAGRPAPEDYLYLPVSTGSTVTGSTTSTSFLAQAAIAAKPCQNQNDTCALRHPLLHLSWGASAACGHLPPIRCLRPIWFGLRHHIRTGIPESTQAGEPSSRPVAFLHQPAPYDQPENARFRADIRTPPRCRRHRSGAEGFEELDDIGRGLAKGHLGTPAKEMMICCGAGTMPSIRQTAKLSHSRLHVHRLRQAIPPHRGVKARRRGSGTALSPPQGPGIGDDIDASVTVPPRGHRINLACPRLLPCSRLLRPGPQT